MCLCNSESTCFVCKYNNPHTSLNKYSTSQTRNCDSSQTINIQGVEFNRKIEEGMTHSESVEHSFFLVRK